MTYRDKARLSAQQLAQPLVPSLACSRLRAHNLASLGRGDSEEKQLVGRSMNASFCMKDMECGLRWRLNFPL